MAQEWIIPKPLSQEQELTFQRETEGEWTAVVEGKGGLLRVQYSSDAEVQLYAVPLWSENEKFLGRDILATTLPAGQGQDVQIDLTQSPRWSPLLGKQYVILRGTNAQTPEVGDITIVPQPVTQLPLVAVRQLMQPEPFSAALYHAPIGYHVFDVPLSMMLGIVMIAGVFVLRLLRKQPAAAVTLLLLLTGVYSLRVSADLLLFTVHNAHAWWRQEPLELAGSLPAVAEEIRKASATSERPLLLFDCTDDSQYSTKFLRYALYPILVTREAEEGITHVLVHQTAWTHDNTTLRCHDVEAQTDTVTSFPDGSTLFSLSPKP